MQITTVAGRSVELRPVSALTMSEIQVQLRLKAIKRGDPIDPPMYEATTATGEKQYFPHDETTLETEEDHKAWQAHQEALARLSEEISEATSRYLLTEGIAVDEIPPEWEQKRRWIGLDVPEDPLDKKLLYIQTELLTTPADMLRAMQAVLHLSATGNAEMEERLAEMDELFRRALEGPAASADSN